MTEQQRLKLLPRMWAAFHAMASKANAPTKNASRKNDRYYASAVAMSNRWVAFVTR